MRTYSPNTRVDVSSYGRFIQRLCSEVNLALHHQRYQSISSVESKDCAGQCEVQGFVLGWLGDCGDWGKKKVENQIRRQL